jgi:hypothetical protein
MDLKPIETVYKGYRFRSRLEARWAVFFDAIDLRWEYEKEGFDLDGVLYLPDFYLTDHHVWIEIKATEPSAADIQKIERFQQAIDHQNATATWHEDGTCDPPFHRVLLAIGEPYNSRATGQVFELRTVGRVCICMTFIECQICGHQRIERMPYTTTWTGDEISYYCTCCDCGPCREAGDPISLEKWRQWFHKGDIHLPSSLNPALAPRLTRAYRAARSARFEHQERERV